jgi:hypothetical protein
LIGSVEDFASLPIVRSLFRDWSIPSPLNGFPFRFFVNTSQQAANLQLQQGNRPDIDGSTSDEAEMQQQGDRPDIDGSTSDEDEMQQAANLQLQQGDRPDTDGSTSDAKKRKASIDAYSARGETQEAKKRRVTTSISGNKYHERALIAAEVTNSPSQSDATTEGTGSQTNLELSSLGIRAARVANIHTSNQLYKELAYEDNKTKDKTKIAADKGLSVWNVDTVDRTKLANTVDRTKLDNTDKPWWYYSIKWEEAVKAKVQIHFKIYKQNCWEDWGCPAAITGEKSVTDIANIAEKKAKEDGSRLYNVELTWLTKKDYLQTLLSTNTDVILIIRAEDFKDRGNTRVYKVS